MTPYGLVTLLAQFSLGSSHTLPPPAGCHPPVLPAVTSSGGDCPVGVHPVRHTCTFPHPGTQPPHYRPSSELLDPWSIYTHAEVPDI